MGSALSTIGKDSIPATTDAVMIPADFVAFTDDIDHKIWHFVTDQNERDVQFAAAAAPLFVASPTAAWFKISGSGGGSVWVTIWGDSGAVTTGITPGTDFDYSAGYVRKLDGKFVIVSLNMIRRNSAITLNTYNHATSPGNIVGDPVIATLPVGYRPDALEGYTGTWRSGTTNGAFRIQSDGTIKLYSGNPNTQIEIDAPVDLSCCFMAA